jgi:methylglyoxal synthase
MKRLAIIAHDNKKVDLVAWAILEDLHVASGPVLGG